MRIIWTRHAEERQKEWEKKLRITRDEVESLINSPVQVVRGDMGILGGAKKNKGWLAQGAFRENGRQPENHHGILDKQDRKILGGEK